MEYRNSCAWRIQVINHHIKVKWLLFLSRANGIFLCIICFHKHFYSSNHVAVFCSLERVRSKKKLIPFFNIPSTNFSQLNIPPCNICFVTFFSSQHFVNLFSSQHSFNAKMPPSFHYIVHSNSFNFSTFFSYLLNIMFSMQYMLPQYFSTQRFMFSYLLINNSSRHTTFFLV